MDDKFHLLNHIRGNDDSIVIWLFNIGVEKKWNGIDSIIRDDKENTIVNHIEEINLLVTKKQDYMILRKPPLDSFVESLLDNGYEKPNFLCPKCEDETKSISELVLEDTELLDSLKKISSLKNVYFVPYGISDDEMEIAKACGLTLVGGTTKRSREVNNKIFSKEVAKKMELPRAKDFMCHNVDEIRESYDKLCKDYSKIIIKMPCNSSGQGMWIVDSEKKLKTVCMIIDRMSRTQNVEEWLVEGWIDKTLDLNIQVYVSEYGEVETFSVKEQIIEGTLYVGSVIPARINDEQYKDCIEYGNRIGHYLYEQGYTGVFGIDALVDLNGTVIPIIEINGRFTLSTYLSFVDVKYPHKMSYCFYLRAHGTCECSYDIVLKQLKNEQMLLEQQTCCFIYNAATLDSGLADGNVRLFCMLTGGEFESLDNQKKYIDKVLNTIVRGGT